MTTSIESDARSPQLRTISGGIGLAAILCVIGCQSDGPAAEDSAQRHDAASADMMTGSLPAAPLPDAAETFDTAWTLIRDTHFDADYNGVDWNAVGDEFRPRAAAATTTSDLRRVLGEMIATLGQSHFSIIPAEVVDAMDPDQWTDSDEVPETSNGTPNMTTGDSVDANSTEVEKDPSESSDTAPVGDADKDAGGRFADPGLDVRLIMNEIIVTGVRAGSPADRAGVAPGWAIDAIGTRETAPLIERLNDDAELDDRFRAYQIAQVVREQLRGAAGTRTGDIRFRNGGDQEVVIALDREQLPGVPIQFGNLPTMIAELNHQVIDLSGSRIGLIAFNIWMLPIARPFHIAVDEYREADGIVIDLRGNPGGVGGMSMGIAGHFFNDQQRLGTMRTRDSELNFVANPRRTTSDRQPTQPYDGPVAILIDEGTASTSEIFAGGLQSVGRARVFGSTSMGAALPARMSRLPNGDVLLHAFADYVDANGEHLEGKGVIPDEQVELKREQLLDGHDPVLDAAIRWIQTQAGTASLSRAAA